MQVYIVHLNNVRLQQFILTPSIIALPASAQASQVTIPQLSPCVDYNADILQSRHGQQVEEICFGMVGPDTMLSDQL